MGLVLEGESKVGGNAAHRCGTSKKGSCTSVSSYGTVHGANKSTYPKELQIEIKKKKDDVQHYHELRCIVRM